MNLSQRIRQLRLEQKWSQAELAQKVGVHQKQISAYERGANNPSTEVLIKLAETFGVTLDYLALTPAETAARADIRDRELLEYFEEIDGFPEEKKKTAKEILDLIVTKNRLQELTKAKR